MFQYMTNLTALGLEGNNFYGTLPPSFSVLHKLYNMHLSSNLLSGTIPSFIATMAGIQDLVLYSNKFSSGGSGSTAAFTNAQIQTKLQTIDISNNEFTGQLMTDPFKLPSLEQFIVVGNCFQG